MLQLGLFLKESGLSVQETLNYFKNFWNASKSSQMQNEKLYNIEHMYGLQGSKKDYTAYGCMKLSRLNYPTGEELHGCPFKMFKGTTKLYDELTTKLGVENASAVYQLADTGEFGSACRKYFEFMHCGEEPGYAVGYHPNAYFKQSHKHYLQNDREKIEIEFDNGKKSVNSKKSGLSNLTS